jgi:hypothetical protein
MTREEIEKYRHKTVMIKHTVKGNIYDQVGIVYKLTIHKLVLLLFDDDHEVYIPYDKIETIKAIKHQ